MLATTYNPKDIEERLYKYWEDSGFFEPNKNEEKSFSVVIPPPNVTGILHIGHALNLSLQDILVRYQRLKGFNVLWIPGTDHAGIATQNVVEKQLAKENINRADLGRTEFINRVWQWKKEYGSRITLQIRRLGASVAWSYERFTMDQGCAAAVQEAFIKLYEEGLIYQGRYIINWCPRCKTALSDIEVENKESHGHLWHIKYFVVDNPKDSIIVATTRPETMFGDVAIAVNPKDERFKNLVGKRVYIPLTNKTIPIITDESVELNFGTGALKITPAHDFNDFETGKKHNLDQVIVIDESGVMNNEVPDEFQGLDRFACRKKLVAKLETAGFLTKIEDHKLILGHCYRCHTVVEPYLSKQWFLSMKQLSKRAIDVVKTKEIEFVPERWEKIYFDWMQNIRDWCISRQIWWGHQIPIWYCKNHPDQPIAGKEKPAFCPICRSEDLDQDPDVLDTWFSSSLWPFSTLGWPEKSKELDTYYPTSVLITGYDILTFWVSRMITMGLKFMDQIPFEKVYIHGLVRDITGKKMSKSIGNALDPLELINEYGADALRFGLASLCTLGGQDIKLAKEKIESSRNFANKIWNVARFILMNLETVKEPIDFTKVDKNDLAIKWILNLFFNTLEKIETYYSECNYALIADTLWDFTWNKFCDWFVEISKLDKEKYLPVLIYLMIHQLKILHPYLPFVTEQIWQELLQDPALANLNEPESLLLARWPKIDQELIFIDKKIAPQMEVIIKVIKEIRNLRKEFNIKPSLALKIILVTEKYEQRLALSQGLDFIQRLAKGQDIEILNELSIKPAQSVSSVTENIKVYLLLDGLIDLEKEKARLSLKIQKIEAEINNIRRKLTNPDFLNKAPKEIIKNLEDALSKFIADKLLIDQQINGLIF
ncbi:MAG: valine--tRNA ligase [Candidatus Margulisiibacteriota bacterium]|jgi:valyl-tRNA synthetase